MVDLPLQLLTTLLSYPQPDLLPSLLSQSLLLDPLIAIVQSPSSPALRPYLMALVLQLSNIPSTLDGGLWEAFQQSGLREKNATMWQQVEHQVAITHPHLLRPGQSTSSLTSEAIAQIQSLFPDLQPSFIQRALAHPSISTPEVLIDRLLEGNLPPDLSTSAPASSPAPAPATNVYVERNYAAPELKADAIVARGKGKDRAVGDLALAEELKAAIILRAEAPSSDEDSDEDEDGRAFLSDSDAGGAKPRAKSHKNEEDSDDEDEEEGEKVPAPPDRDAEREHTLLSAYLKSNTLWARKTPEREALKKATGMDDEIVEGWRWALDHDPKKERRLDALRDVVRSFTGNTKGEKVAPPRSNQNGSQRGGGRGGTYFTGILAMTTFKRDYGTLQPNGSYAIDSTYTSLFASIVQAGEFVGALAAGFIGNKSGRKGAMAVACCTVALGAILQLIVTGSLPLLVVGRLILGMGVGIISNCTTLYLSEIPPAAIRGSMVSSWQLFLALGQVLGAGVAQGTKDYSSTFSYRFPIALNIAIVIIILTGMFFIPESPRWYVSRHKDDQAARALERVHADNPEADIAAELRHMTNARESEIAESGGSTSWSEIFKGVERRKLICVFGILVSQQISGVQFIFSYGTVFFESIGIANPFLITMVIDILEVVGVVFSFFLVNRFGRRPLLLWTATMMAVVLLICGALGCVPNPSKSVNSAIASMIGIYVFVFNTAWGPLAWVVATELAGGRNRSRIMSVGTAAFWIAAWAVTFTLPYLYDPGFGDLGPKVGFIYGGGAVISIIFVYFYIPETLGRSLEEINMLLELGVPTRAWKGYHAHLDGKRVEPSVVDAKASQPRQRFLEDVATDKKSHDEDDV